MRAASVAPSAIASGSTWKAGAPAAIATRICSRVACEQEPASTTGFPAGAASVSRGACAASLPAARKLSGSPIAMPEPPVISGKVRAGRADRAQMLVADRVDDEKALALGARVREAGADRVGAPFDDRERDQPDLALRPDAAARARDWRRASASADGPSSDCRTATSARRTDARDRSSGRWRETPGRRS